VTNGPFPPIEPLHLPDQERRLDAATSRVSHLRHRKAVLGVAGVALLVAGLVVPITLTWNPTRSPASRVLGGPNPTSVASSTLPTTSTSVSPTSTTALSLPSVWRTRSVPAGLTAPLNDVTCPTPYDCYAVSGDSNGAHPGAIIASTDGGATWHVQYTAPPAGAGQAALTAVTCTSATQCLAVGGSGSDAVAVVTHDGGHHWTPLALPPQLGYLRDVACPSSMVCVGVGQNSGYQGGPGIVRTVDGGASWTTVAVPAGVDSVYTVSCPSSSSCLLGGQTPGASCCSQALASTSEDAGRTWGRPVVTGAAGDPWLQDISCVDTRTCVGVHGTNGTDTWGQGDLTITRDGGRTWSTLPSVRGEDVSCTSALCFAVGAMYDQAANVYSSTAFRSTDGGRTWAPVSTPRSQGFSSVACTTRNDCVVVGNDKTPAIMTYGH
jgi:hypothetical protein